MISAFFVSNDKGMAKVTVKPSPSQPDAPQTNVQQSKRGLVVPLSAMCPKESTDHSKGSESQPTCVIEAGEEIDRSCVTHDTFGFSVYSSQQNG